MVLKKITGKALKAFQILRSKTLTKAAINGVAAATEHLDMLKSLGDINILIDIGANKGQFSVLFKYIYPKSLIFAFEPLKSPSKTYRKLFDGEKNVWFYKFAIGFQKKEMEMNVSRREDSSSLLKIGEKQTEFFPGTDFDSFEKVEMSNLSSFISPEQINQTVLVKIDVQGFELEVLKGSEDLIKYFDYIYVECSYKELYQNQPLVSEVVQFLFDKGFGLEGVYNNFFDTKGVAIQADFLFKNQQ